MEISPAALASASSFGPVHRYRVVFWRQPKVAEADLPAAVTQDRVVWAADYKDVANAQDVAEVLDWATEEARSRGAIFTLSAVIEWADREGVVWLAGWNPTVHSGDNFDRRQPSEVDPVHGTPGDVYGGRDQ